MGFTERFQFAKDIVTKGRGLAVAIETTRRVNQIGSGGGENPVDTATVNAISSNLHEQVERSGILGVLIGAERNAPEKGK